MLVTFLISNPTGLLKVASVITCVTWKHAVQHVIRLPYINVTFFTLENDQKSRRAPNQYLLAGI